MAPPLATVPVAASTPVEVTAPTPATPDTPTPDTLTPDTPTLEVVARLVEPRSAPHCGGVHFVVVMRYEVVKVVKGSHAATELYVAHSCPELVATPCKDLPGARIKGFRAGDLHHMKLETRRGSGMLVDEFPDKTSRRYRVRCANLEPM